MSEQKLTPEQKTLLVRVALAVAIIVAAVMVKKMGYPVPVGKWLLLAVKEWR
jgi:hypothetical protein